MSIKTLHSMSVFFDDETTVNADEHGLDIGGPGDYVALLTIQKPAADATLRFASRLHDAAAARKLAEDGVDTSGAPEGENLAEWFDWMASQSDPQVALAAAHRAQLTSQLLEWAVGYFRPAQSPVLIGSAVEFDDVAVPF